MKVNDICHSQWNNSVAAGGGHTRSNSNDMNNTLNTCFRLAGAIGLLSDIVDKCSQC